jgi:group I intron endonuclease
MNGSGIYKIENLVNGNIYIGQTSNLERRKRDHWRNLKKCSRANKYLQNSWNKYGEDSFVFKIVLFCEKSELTYYEQALVDRLSPVYNIKKECVISCLGVRATEETKRKMSDARMGEKNWNFGNHHSEETLRKISEANKGRRRTEETLKKLSEAAKGRNNPRFGVHLSDETKKKISESEKGKTISDEQKMAVSKAHLGKPLSEEHRKKIGEANRRRALRNKLKKEGVLS